MPLSAFLEKRGVCHVENRKLMPRGILFQKHISPPMVSHGLDGFLFFSFVFLTMPFFLRV